MRLLPLLSLVAALAVSGCAGFDLAMLGSLGVDPAKATEKVKKIEDATLGNAVKPLPFYCKAPGTARALFRSRVNARPEAKGAQIGIWCPGDSPLTLGAP